MCKLKLIGRIIIDRIWYGSHDQSDAVTMSCRTQIFLSFNHPTEGESRLFTFFSCVSTSRGVFGFLGDQRERKTEPHGVHRLASSLSRPSHLFVFHIDRVLIQPCTVVPHPSRAPLNPRRTPPVNHRDGPPSHSGT